MTIKFLSSLAVAPRPLAATARMRARAQLMSVDLCMLNAVVRTLGKARPQTGVEAAHGTRGKFTDFVPLSQDMFRITPVEIGRTIVRPAIMDGRIVYEEKR